MLRFWIKAIDNKETNPNTGKSESIEFTVITPEEKRTEILQKWKAALDKIQQLIQMEVDNKKGVDKIRTPKTK